MTVFTLRRLDIIKLKDDILEALNSKLEMYERPVRNEVEGRFLMSFHEIEYNGNKYQLETRRNQDHNNILEYTISLEYLERALAENYDLKICFLRGLKCQDDKFLRHINYICSGKTETDNIIEEFKNLLTQKQVLDTLQRLEEFGCLTKLGQTVILTELGKNIV